MEAAATAIGQGFCTEKKKYRGKLLLGSCTKFHLSLQNGHEESRRFGPMIPLLPLNAKDVSRAKIQRMGIPFHVQMCRMTEPMSLHVAL